MAFGFAGATRLRKPDGDHGASVLRRNTQTDRLPQAPEPRRDTRPAKNNTKNIVRTFRHYIRRKRNGGKPRAILRKIRRPRRTSQKWTKICFCRILRTRHPKPHIRGRPRTALKYQTAHIRQVVQEQARGPSVDLQTRRTRTYKTKPPHPRKSQRTPTHPKTAPKDRHPVGRTPNI